jgi:hypothetical protein
LSDRCKGALQSTPLARHELPQRQFQGRRRTFQLLPL